MHSLPPMKTLQADPNTRLDFSKNIQNSLKVRRKSEDIPQVCEQNNICLLNLKMRVVKD